MRNRTHSLYFFVQSLFKLGSSQSHHTDRAHREKGGILIESALSLPLLWLFLVAVVDLGRFTIQYVGVHRVAYEGARAAAGNIAMRFDNDGEPEAAPEVKRRMTRLLSHYGVNEDEVSFSISYDTSTTKPIVRIGINAPFTPLFSLFRTTGLERIKVAVEAPHLYPI